MEKQLQEIKMEIMQDRLDSLELRFKELANNHAHLSAKQLSKQCISCMEAIRNLSSDCLIENTHRYLHRFNRNEFIQHVRETRQSMRFDVDGNSIIKCNYLEAGHNRQMTEEERHDRFMSLKAGVPPAKFCFPPYNAHELFVELAANLENFAIRELEYHGQPYVPDPTATNQPPPPYESQGRGLQCRSSPHPTAAAMPSVESSFGSGASFESIATDMSGDEESKEAHFMGWAQRQRDAYDKYLQLPVTPKVVSDVLSHYYGAEFGRVALPLGLQLYRLCPGEGGPVHRTYEAVIPDFEGVPCYFNEGDIEALTTTRDRLRDENWDSRPVLERDVPAAHPLLPDWMVTIQKPVTEELRKFGLVVAWGYHGTEALMDRYGHLIAEV
ncbi:hypothetical protein FAGAP_4902 [Fusarium agapanthi]|uniref:Uncharacterized protein n=1 Tax=Fusarium agapanthi TaxID=1803897 RepID=A0A9P5EDJ0_9HYPO|nr:hypothetical protein FAGAP_4902 [Fusarium agapanthi]